MMTTEQVAHRHTTTRLPGTDARSNQVGELSDEHKVQAASRSASVLQSETAITVSAGVCPHADLAMAHEQMRAHRACRIDRCGWKAAAHRTLVATGRLVPQAMSPRERAAARGLPYPVASVPTGAGAEAPDAARLREVLRILDELALPPDGVSSSPVGGWDD